MFSRQAVSDLLKHAGNDPLKLFDEYGAMVLSVSGGIELPLVSDTEANQLIDARLEAIRQAMTKIDNMTHAHTVWKVNHPTVNTDQTDEMVRQLEAEYQRLQVMHQMFTGLSLKYENPVLTDIIAFVGDRPEMQIIFV